MEILSPKKSQSGYIKNRVAQDVELHSNGETAMRYFLDRIDGDGLYLLDEPENSLSIEFQLELVDYISAVARSTRSQFIIATHSPFILAMKGARIYDFDANPARPRIWTDLPAVRTYFEFFNSKRELFEDKSQ